MAVLRTLLGEALRTTRLSQDRTLREVSSAARVSLGYLSEVERGQKEASSELLASICRALGVRLSDVLRDVSESLSVLEPEPAPLVAAGASAGPTGPTAVPTPVPAAAPAVPETLPDTLPDVLPDALPALEPVGAARSAAVHAVAGARRVPGDVVAAA